MRRTIIMALMGLVAVLWGGCGVNPTGSMKVNSATLTDGLMFADKHGLKAGSPLAKQLVKNAVTNETILANDAPIKPEQRIPVAQIATAGETNRAVAQKDAEEGGTWTMFGNTAIDLVVLGLGVFGMGTAATWVNGQRKTIKEVRTAGVKATNSAEIYRVKAERWQEKALKYEGRFKTVVKGVGSALGVLDAKAGGEVKTAIGRKASDAAEPKADFDAAVDAVVNGTA